MKKTRVKTHAAGNSKDTEFAKKILSQLVVSIIIFTFVFVNSKLHNNISVSINNQIKYYLTSSIDINKTINTAMAYFQGFWNHLQTTPVNGDTEVETTNES